MTNPEDRNRVLIKFMDEKYVDTFVNEGLIYMNTIKYFREYEDSDPALRGDSNEGLSSSFLPEKVVLELNGHVITGAVDKIDLRESHNDETNIYCMTVISDKDILDAGKDGLYLSSKFKKFGNKAVFIGGSDIKQFFSRINETLNNNRSIYSPDENSIVGRKVKYLDRKDHHRRLNIFNKFTDYERQLEWRLALKQNITKGAFELRIGDLSDIAHIADTESILCEPIKFTKNGL